MINVHVLGGSGPFKTILQLREESIAVQRLDDSLLTTRRYSY